MSDFQMIDLENTQLATIDAAQLELVTGGGYFEDAGETLGGTLGYYGGRWLGEKIGARFGAGKPGGRIGGTVGGTAGGYAGKYLGRGLDYLTGGGGGSDPTPASS